MLGTPTGPVAAASAAAFSSCVIGGWKSSGRSVTCTCGTGHQDINTNPLRRAHPGQVGGGQVAWCPMWRLTGEDKARGWGRTPQLARRKGLLGLTRDRNFSTERCSSDLNSGTGVWMSLQAHCPFLFDALPTQSCQTSLNPSIPAAVCSLWA